MSEHPNVQILRGVYADLTRLGDHADDAVLLHRADRTVGTEPVRGVDAVMAHERALIALTNDTLVMDVEHITATDYFGAVLGVLRATSPKPIAMPFCGLWRFDNGRITEHWENAYSAAAFVRLLTS